MNSIEAVKVLREAIRLAGDNPNIDQSRKIADDAIAATENIEQDEPVNSVQAWAHDDPERYDVIHDEAKRLWLAAKPAHVEDYSIPLYSRGAASAEANDFFRNLYKRKFEEAIAATPQPAPQPAKADVVAPDGFKLVPIIPTAKMVSSGVVHEPFSSYTTARAIYATMIAAAPSPEPQP